MPGTPIVLRGPAISFTGDPFRDGLERTMVHWPDAAIAIEDGKILRAGPAPDVLATLPQGTAIEDYGPDSLLTAGFVDTHVHFPQTPMIASPGGQLLDWPERYTFPPELRFADLEFARDTARVFLQECLRNGVTTSCVYCTVHPHSVDALFEEAERLGLRIAAGKVMMDRNAPEALCDTAQTGYDQSAALIAKWHGRGRLMYAVTPRFAGSSTPEQLEAAGALWRAHPDCLMQTHISENKREVAWMKELFPERLNYLDIYDHHGLVGPRAVFGHGIWLEESELQRLHDGGSAISHCPTSNLFLGSGAFNLRRALDSRRPVRVGIGTDIGAGTSFSILATMGEGYRAALQHQQTLSAEHALYLATRGGARAMYLDDRIGSLTSGLEADIAVLDMKSTPLIAYRMEQARDLGERLFVQMMLGDDRAIHATYVAGRLAYKRRR